MDNNYIYEVKEAITHGGVFHSDDVFSTAFIQILNPEIKVKRLMQVPEGFDGLVYDIGLGRFDHHQKDRRVRDNGIPYAAFGLLFEEFGTLVMSKEDAVIFDETFIQPIDKSDNTGSFWMICDIISDFNPDWIENQDRDEAFWRAVAVAKEILVNKFRQINANRKAYYLVKEEVDACSGPVLELSKTIPWDEAVKGTDILYVIYASERGGYNVQTVRVDGTEEEKKPFPADWRGKPADYLQKVTGVDGITFCHNSGFLCAVKTIEDARRIAELAVKA